MSSTLAFMRAPFWSASATVSTSGVDTDYQASWLCDLRPNRPVRWTSGSMSATIANTFGAVDAIVVGNHKLDAGLTITVEGDVHLTFTVPALPPDGVPLNPFTLVGSPASADSINISVSGNSVDVVIGEIAIGALEFVGLPLLTSAEFEHRQNYLMPDVDVSSVLGYDKGTPSRIFRGTYLLTEAEKNSVVAWYQSQRGMTQPSVIIPDLDVNDAWFVWFKELKYRPVVSQVTANASNRLWTADLVFEEIPRTRW